MIRNRAFSLALATVLAAPVAFSQPTPPAPPKAPMARGQERGMGGGMGIVPPGTWWRNPDVITALTLTADQQKKLDDIFLQSRINLIHLHASLEEEQLKLEPLLDANPPDQVKSLAEISKIADLRADVEKADAKMLLSLRSVLTADQWTKMQADQHARHDRSKDDRKERGQDRGPKGQRGPQGPPGQNGPPNGPPPIQ